MTIHTNGSKQQPMQLLATKQSSHGISKPRGNIVQHVAMVANPMPAHGCSSSHCKNGELGLSSFTKSLHEAQPHSRSCGFEASASRSQDATISRGISRFVGATGGAVIAASRFGEKPQSSWRARLIGHQARACRGLETRAVTNATLLRYLFLRGYSQS